MPNKEELGLTRHTRALLRKDLPRPVGRAFSPSEEDVGINLRLRAASMREFELSETCRESIERRKLLKKVQTRQRRSAIRKYILESAQAAYPNPIKSIVIRNKLRKEGMTEGEIGKVFNKYRHEKILRRDGHQWFFVPEDQR